jgi:hypothetical protein
MTHTATTTVGSVTSVMSMAEYTLGVTMGVDNVCWKGLGCLDSDTLVRFDHAVADGVDDLLVSIGGGMIVTFYLDPIMIGAYNVVS